MVEGDANRIRQRGAGADRIWRGKRGERRQAESGEEAATVAVGGGGMFLWVEEGEGMFLCVRATWTISLAGLTPNGEKQTEHGRNGL